MSTPLNRARARLGALSPDELRTLAGDVAALLADQGDDLAEAGRAAGDDRAAGSGRAGHIEYKTINGCGPYAYLRRRVGGKYTSTYLGKVEA